MYHNVSKCMTIKFMTMYYIQLAQLVVVVALILAVFVFLTLSRFKFNFQDQLYSLLCKSKSRLISQYVVDMWLCSLKFQFCKKEQTIKIHEYDDHHMIIWSCYSYDDHHMICRLSVLLCIHSGVTRVRRQVKDLEKV